MYKLNVLLDQVNLYFNMDNLLHSDFNNKHEDHLTCGIPNDVKNTNLRQQPFFYLGWGEEGGGGLGIF